MFIGGADRYYTDYVAPHATDVNGAFNHIKEHFMTPAHKNTYITEWNTPNFQEIKIKHAEKTNSQCLDLLVQRTRDL